MSKAVQYKKLEKYRQRLALLSMITTVFYLSTVLIGGVAYGNLKTTPSVEYSLFMYFSFIALVAAALLIFLAKNSTAMGEFSSAKKLIYSAMAATAVAIVSTTSALVISEGAFATELFYVYVTLQLVALALSTYLLMSLRGVVAYYTPRRK